MKNFDFVVRSDGKLVAEFKHARPAGELLWRLKCEGRKNVAVLMRSKINKKETKWFD